MNKELISIIVPVYNVEKYLVPCLDSILNQTYYNIEVLLIDDGSTDKSGEICDQYSIKNKNVFVIHQQNKGLSGARNTGIEFAKGQYLCFIDSDDYVEKEYVLSLYKLICDNQVKISECGVCRFMDGFKVNNKGNNKEKKYSYKEWLTESGLGDFLNCTVWNKMFSRDLFEDIKFPLGKVFEDEATTYKLVYKAGSVARTYCKLYNYRVRNNSIITTGVTPQKLLNQIFSIKDKISFFEQRNEYCIADFFASRHAISLISLYKTNGKLVETVYGSRNEISREILSIIKRIVLKRIVPIKYKLFILYNYIMLFK